MKGIVFIDDDMRRMQYYVEYLQLDGFPVKWFENDRIALGYIQTNRDWVGLIVLDMIMSSKLFTLEETSRYFDTGLHLLREIRTVLPHVPVIVFSIRDDLENMPGLKELKVRRILVKDRTTPRQLSSLCKEIVGKPA